MNIAVIAYENACKMLTRRGLDITKTVTDLDSIPRELANQEFVRVIGEGNDPTLVVIIAAGSKYANASTDFKKLITKIIAGTQNTNKSMRILIVASVDDKPSIYIHRAIAAMNDDYKGKYEISHHSYELFCCDIQSYVGAPKHSIATKEEVDEYCKHHYVLPTDFPKIMVSDPQAIWIGLRRGQCARIERYSETAGIAIIYRYCI